MTRTIQHEIQIGTPPAAVRAQAIGTSAYGDWNPFVRRLGGELTEVARLTVEIAPPGGRTMTFKPIVVAAEAGRELRPVGRLLVAGVLDAEHSFRLEALPDGRTRFVHAQVFRGVLDGFVGATLDKTRVGFEQMNSALKQRVEAAVA